MTKQTEALKLALDALEEPHPGVRTSFTDALTYREKVKQAIATLREALAEQASKDKEQAKTDAYIKQLDEALAQDALDKKAENARELGHEEVESLSSENIRLQNLVKDLSDWNDKLRERLSYREAYPDNFLKEPEQEPVAIVSGYYGGQCVILPMQPDRILNSGTIFYTSPPAQRRPWAELNYEDIHALMNEFFYSGMQPSAAHFANFARAIEAKLKEKNT